MCFTMSLFWILSHLARSERKEYAAFRELVQIVPGLDSRLMELSEEEVIAIADLVCFLLTIVVILILVFRISASEGCQRC